MKTTKTLSLIAIAALVLAACGSGDDSTSDSSDTSDTASESQDDNNTESNQEDADADSSETPDVEDSEPESTDSQNAAANSDDYMAGLTDKGFELMRAEQLDDDIEITDGTIRCTMAGVLDEIGEETLRDNDVNVSNLEDKMEGLADDELAGTALVNCMSREELLQMAAGQNEQERAMFECMLDEAGLEGFKTVMIEQDPATLGELALACADVVQ